MKRITSANQEIRVLRPALFSALLAFAMAFSALTMAAGNDQDVIGKVVGGLKMRSIGPALMGGRIADIAVHPGNKRLWYVASASGGVWKTDNAGTTWTPVFDEQKSYSIADVEIDPNNPDVIWVGTGENVSGRHVGWGDGVYKSTDAGRTWTSMGLERSEHIGKIMIHPDDGDVVYVASEGPLWSAGGERGLYKTVDGGLTWTHILDIDENTGVTDIEFHPNNPDMIYAAAYERRRHVWGLMAGGPNGGIYKSSDAGGTWKKLEKGLPKGHVGKIGLAVTEAAPGLVYATIEASDDEKGFYRSEDQGEAWQLKNAYISGGTGPHYYQELAASPQDPSLVFQMDVFFHVTRDGGQNFSYLGTGRDKHSDNHALWIDPEDDLHLIAGTDAGLYETFDQGASWRHFPNLPISQFYKVAVDNDLPFYNILGGAQDLGTLFGPSRTMTTEGVRNQDWYVPLGADGYGVAFDPEDPNISYMEYQVGYLFRHHRDSNELVHIQPQPAPGDPPERWNWDTPILISPHKASRLYVGSQRLWRSEDRGHSWQAISPDLTTNQNRYELPFQGRTWSVDDLHDNGAMSKYSTLTGISESPVTEGVIYTASDDGLVHVSSDGGGQWRKARALPDLPADVFINDIEASLFDADTVFVVADVHKSGDYSPYVFISTNQGRSWQSISGDLPAGTILWAIQQDHVNPNLLFLGTEFGIYVTLNGGENWHRAAGTPSVAFRDIKLQRRDNDLVGASFGRGFYILDDYSPLRDIAGNDFDGQNHLFPIRDAWWYIPSVPSQAIGMPTLGTDSFKTANPDFGAMITLFLAEELKSSKDQRRQKEKKRVEEGQDIPFPGWDRLTAELLEAEPRVMVLIRDEQNRPIRWLKAKNTSGTQRISWDLRLAPPDAIELTQPDFVPPWAGPSQGPLAAPGRYTAQLFAMTQGNAASITAPRDFQVKPVPSSNKGVDYVQVAEYQQKAADLVLRVNHANEELKRTADLLKYMKAAAVAATRAEASLFTQLDELDVQLARLKTRLAGDPVRARLNEARMPGINARAYNAANTARTTLSATATQQSDYEIAMQEFADFEADLASLMKNLEELESGLLASGAPSWR